MITHDNPYYRQVQLLVRVLPAVAAEGCFALKGGTAINLFVRDLPRLSVDIDLAFLPITEFDVARRQISEALGRIRARLVGASPAYKVTTASASG
jgi:nucleotidyltransferase AbiEii toxin of type IV toxin-antitoxin system